jgi:hypothetical protein
MANLFYTRYKAVFAAVASKLTAASLTPKLVGENFALAPDAPVILIDAQPAFVKPLDMDSDLEVTVRMDLLVLVRETVPASWFDDIITVMGKVADAILADRTLNGSVRDVYPTTFSPGVINYRNKTFYGGSVGLTAVYYFAP